MKLTALILIALAAPAGAAEVGGVSFPKKVTTDGQVLLLNGAGLRLATVFHVRAYAGALYLAKRTSNPHDILRPDAPKQYVAVFLRGVSRERAAGAFIDGIRKSAPDEGRAITSEIETFRRWMPAFEKYDRITVTYLPGRGLRIEAPRTNGPFKGTDAFASALFAIWIGDRAVDASLRAKLLGKE